MTPPDRPDRAHGDAHEELERIYSRLDADLAALGAGCRACGRCCTFPPDGPVLYASALEREHLASTAPPGPRTGGAADTPREPGACPYLALARDGGRCAARSVRPVGCRTYFCKNALPDRAMRERAMVLAEVAVADIRRVVEDCGLEWDYAPVVERLRDSRRRRTG